MSIDPVNWQSKCVQKDCIEALNGNGNALE